MQNDQSQEQPNAGLDEVDVTAGPAGIIEDTASSDTGALESVIAVDDDKPLNDFNWPAPTPLNNATISSEYSRAPEVEWEELGVTITLPADTQARTLNYGEQNPHAADIVDTEDGQRWAEAISNGMSNASFADNMLPAFKREGANYQNRILGNGGKPLTIAQPRLGGDDGPLLTGERAMLRVNALLGRGAIIQIPLWHSGFWMTIKTPAEIDLLDTLQHISDNKIAFGRSSNGLTFANHVVVSNSAVVDLAMRNLYETTVQGFNTVEKIRGAINALDIPLIAHGLACSIYPRGFQFERALLDAKGVKTEVVRQLLNVSTCLYVDGGSLNEWQIGHMSKRSTGAMTESELKIYREHFARGKPKSIPLNEHIGITLRVPSIDQYLNAGQRWVDELVFAVNQAFTQDLTEKQRNEMIFDRAKATSMRQYCHWIESIDLLKSDQKITDAESIERTINSLSSDDTIRNKYYEIVRQFINDSTISLIGVPQVHPDEGMQVLPRFENLIPLDPIAVFFNLLYQKIQQIRLRP